MHRRDFVLTLAAAPLLSVTGRLYAAPVTNARLLVVFLRGGYDATNVLIPITSSFYYEARPNIAIAKPGTGPGAALPLDADWGLHPALRESILPLFQKGQAAFVPFAGTDNLSRSHFETQDSIEMGQAPDGGRRFDSGFMNRLVTALAGARPIAFTNQLPLIMRGTTQVPNMALRALGQPAVDSRQQAVIADMYRETRLAPQVDKGFSARREIMQDMAAEMEAASRNALTSQGFELEARRIGKLMNERFNVGFVDVGGWDTHVGQGAGAGYLATRLEELGRGLAALAEEMGAAWRDTVVVVISEFGRTFRENGNRGTDHGHGTVYWVLGGSIRGGRILGRQVRLEQATLFQNRDYPVLTEYRSMLGGLFTDMYGLGANQIQGIFPAAGSLPLGLL
jgi:uncharacterized protein (DUF1501 family)